jgi:hypothetical protein
LLPLPRTASLLHPFALLSATIACSYTRSGLRRLVLLLTAIIISRILDGSLERIAKERPKKNITQRQPVLIFVKTSTHLD